MNTYVAIDFETANPQRNSACALGFIVVSKGKKINSGDYRIKPIGHYNFRQVQIHGLNYKDTKNELDFISLYPQIKYIFDYPLIGYGPFDKQVLNALSKYFNLNLVFEYTNVCQLAKKKLPQLSKHNLNLVSDYFKLPPFAHHSPYADALACARVYAKLRDIE